MAGKPTYEELEQRVRDLENEAAIRRQAEEKLRLEKRRLDSLVQHSSLAIVTLDEKHNIVSCNRYFEGLFKLEESRIVGRNLDEVLGGGAPSEDARHYTETTLRGETIHGSGRRYRGDGTIIDVEFYGVPVIVDGAVVGAYGIYQDISERTRAQQALRESEEKYRTLVEESFDGIFVQKGPRIVFANSRLHEMLGYGKGELLGLDHWLVYHPDYQKLTKERAQGRMRGEKVIPQYEVKLQHKDGSWFYGEVNARPIAFDGEPGVQVWVRDLTERKKMEAQFQQAQKMEAIGTLAGGIAHDFNNLLMGMQGNASLMLMDTDSGHSHYERLKNIERYVRRGSELTKQLLGFARGGKYDVKPTDLNVVVNRSSEMFGRTKKEITIHSKYQEDIWRVEIDRGQIEQVLLNLYVNAWQAMPGGGELYLETENVILGEAYVRPFRVGPGRYVRISVTDTGIGMDTATRERIFDPFFTTKEMGRGTGLGLASAYGIIRNHGGIINVYSEKGHGATFNIYLPVTDADASGSGVRGESSEVSEDFRPGHETILLVDDEEMIIDTGKEMLEVLGYRALTAWSGKEAIDIYTRNKDRVDMVILDMIMPEMSGGKTYDRLKEIRPDIRVLLSSGYSVNGQATLILERGCNGFIQKPFNLNQLSQKIRSVLDKK